MKMSLINVTLCLVALTLLPASIAQEQTASILAVIERSAGDWNRGDLDAFVQCYEQSPDTTFVGTEISKGTDALLSRYKRTYPDRGHMGTLLFSEPAVRPLSADIAIVTGRFHLEREADFGGDTSGIFTLVLRKGPSGWRIIHDHTSATN